MKTTTTNTRVLGTMSLIMCLGITTTGAANTCSEVPGGVREWNMWVNAVDVNNRHMGRNAVKKMKYRRKSNYKAPTTINTPPKTSGYRGNQYRVNKVELTRVRKWIKDSAKAEEVTASFCDCGAVFTVGDKGQNDGGFHLMMKINDTKSNKCNMPADYGAWVNNSHVQDCSFSMDVVRLLVDEARYKSICENRSEGT